MPRLLGPLSPTGLSCFLAVLLLPSPASARQVGGVVVTQGPAGRITFQSGPIDQPVRDTRPATGRSTIRGRVLALEGGQPMRRAMVRVTAPELRVPRTMLTDADGRYAFSDLPAGRYAVNASKIAFVSWSYGQTQPGTPGRPLVLADNQTAADVDIRLPRGAVITGHITDEFGDSVPSARVTLMRQQFRLGQRTLTPANNATTNDIGEYRIFGLTPGQYYISAMPQQGFLAGPAVAQGGVLEGQEARNGYAPTFYPGTSDATAAQRLTVGVGQTLTEINVALVATRTATISGTAVDAEGRPMVGGFVQIMSRGGISGLGGAGGSLRPDGTFSVPNIAPGAYVLRANSISERVLSPSGLPVGPPEFSLAYVTVNGEDITDVRLTRVVPVNITGRISFEDPAAAQSLKPSAVRVATLAATVGDAGIGVGSGGSPLPVNEDFTFDLKTTPGQMAIRAVVPGWQIKAVRVGGKDVTDSGLDVGAQGVSDVEIEMTNRLQEISGVVTDADGKAVDSYAVVIFAQDRSRRVAAMNRYGATGRPGTDGQFKVTTLPAGDYYAIALDRSDAIEGQDPDFLESLTRLASPVSLAPGDKRTLDLKLFIVQ
jgi:hypothetical protein